MLVFFNILANISFFTLLGFTLNLSIFNIILKGYLGNRLNLFLLKKIQANDFIWLNVLILICTFIWLNMIFNPIYLDNTTTVEVTTGGMKININGDFLDILFNKFGAATAFGLGAKIAGSFLVKSNMNLLGKIGTVAAAGSTSALSFQLTNLGGEVIKASIVKKMISDKVVELELENVKLVTNSKTTFIRSFEDIRHWNKLQFEKDFSNLFPNWNTEITSNIHTITNGNNKIVTMIKDLTDKTIPEIFGETETVEKNIEQVITNVKNTDVIPVNDTFINSTIESNEIYFSKLQNQLSEILAYSFTLNIIMIYFIFMLIIIFSIKVLIDKQISIEFLKSLPFGKFIYFIINKFISFWSTSNILWIYFILFFLLMASCASTFGLYVITFALKNI